MTTSQERVERSSLGTNAARLARNTVSAEVAAALVSRAAAMPALIQPTRQKSGGKRQRGT